MSNQTVPQFDPQDIEQNKVISGISYLWILFFLPLVACPASRFGRYNANQALVLFICEIAVSVVFSILTRIPFLGWLFGIVLALVNILFFVAILYCLISTIQGKVVKLPVLGDITIIK